MITISATNFFYLRCVYRAVINTSHGMGLGGGGGMTARVGVRGGTTGFRFDKKCKLQGSEGSSWSYEVSLVATAGPLGLEQIHPGRKATRRRPRPKTMKSGKGCGH